MPLKLLVIKPCDFPPEVLIEMQLRKVKSVIDVGCGKGVASSFLPEFEYTGIDKANYGHCVDGSHRHANFIWNMRIQDYIPHQVFDAAWVKCIFCLNEINKEEVEIIVAWLKRWVKYIFLLDTPRIDIDWQKNTS